MKKFGLILLIVGLALAMALAKFKQQQNCQYLGTILFSSGEKRKDTLSYSCEAWAIQTSNTITAGFMNNWLKEALFHEIF